MVTPATGMVHTSWSCRSMMRSLLPPSTSPICAKTPLGVTQLRAPLGLCRDRFSGKNGLYPSVTQSRQMNQLCRGKETGLNGIKYSIIQRHPPTRMRFYFLLPLQKVPLKINYYEYFEKNRSVYLAPLF